MIESRIALVRPKNSSTVAEMSRLAILSTLLISGTSRPLIGYGRSVEIKYGLKLAWAAVDGQGTEKISAADLKEVRSCATSGGGASGNTGYRSESRRGGRRSFRSRAASPFGPWGTERTLLPIGARNFAEEVHEAC